MPIGTYEIRVTLKYVIRVRATSREGAIAFWRERGSKDAQGNLTEEAKAVLEALNLKRLSDYEPEIELIEEMR